ncbi:transposase-like zinc-binding domain-containing protein [Avibacterium gallinarum]
MKCGSKKCTFFSSSSIQKHGEKNGIQHYKCRHCHKIISIQKD